MTKLNVLLRLGLIFMVSAATSHQLPQANQELPGRALTGAWQGALTVPGGALRIIFNFKPKPDSGYTVSLDSPDQGAKGIPGDSVGLDGPTVYVSIKVIGGSYHGLRAALGDSIVGKWSQSGLELPLVLHYAGNQVEGPKRPQEPKRPYPYTEEDVTYTNADAGITLAGTLTLPPGVKPVPAVILITGSGPQDRDEQLLGHKPFLVLADYLTRRGIAVLRTDDRGIGKSGGTFGTATTQDFASDVRSAIKYLKARKEIRAARIGLIGHSEGGIIAPMVAAYSKDVAFIVLMAGTGVNGEEVVLEQSAQIARKMGATEEATSANNSINKKIYEVVKSSKDSVTEYRELQALFPKATASMDSAAAAALIGGQIRQVTSPWFKYFLTYDPLPALRHVSCPVLAIGGEKDLQVPPRQNLPAIESALRAGGNADFTVRELPGLNHLFQTAEKGTPDEYAKIEETISPSALSVIGDWIAERCR